uniref:Uncharacterized protein n=1 Tax=viral metagenome TaxID=1070528 RepID=A0A6H2A5I7_9ZZZZ
MTDRIRRLTVLLEQDTRDDDAEGIISAIRMVRGVAFVEPHVLEWEAQEARMTALFALRKEISEFMSALWEPK